MVHDAGSQNAYQQEKSVSKRFDKEIIRRLLAYFRPYRFLVGIALLLLIFSRIIEAVIPVFVGQISQVILNGSALEAFQKSQKLDLVVQHAIYLLLLMFMSYLFESSNIVLKSWIGQKSLYKFRLDVYEHVLRMPVAYFDKNSIGRLMTRTIHDVDQINLMFAECIIPIFGSVILFVTIFCCLLYINWHIALLVLGLLPLMMLLTHYFRSVQRRCFDRQRTVVAAMNTFVQEHLMGASTVRSFGLQEPSKKRFDAINTDHCNSYAEGIFNFGFFMSGIDFIQNLALIFAFAIIVMVTHGQTGFQAGTYVTFSLYVAMIFRPLADLAERYNLVQSAIAAAGRIFDVMDTDSERDKDQGQMELERVETIAFEDVWFAYKDENWVLRGLTFQQAKGDSIALVGMTGEGKSTIMSLLLRFYEIQKGTIRINGQDIRSYTLTSLRQQFSVVLQDPVIFSGTIAENISIFNSEIPRRLIQESIDYLGMSASIERFPNKLEHHLHEQGKGLSAGEKQLISLARAMVNNRSLVILDEATANIDTATEQIIQQALKKILGATTAIVIAHRLSTIKDVSRILVIEGGRIVEQGTHEALIVKKGIYEKLYRLQFQEK